MVTIRAPEAPNGWPRAIAPPLTLTLLGSSRKHPHRRHCLGGERLVDLDQIELVGRQTCPGQRLLARRDRAHPHHIGMDARSGPDATIRAIGCEPVPVNRLLGGQQQCGGSIVHR